MFNKFTYTPDHEKDWQKLDREFGPLKGFSQQASRDDCIRTPTLPDCPTPPAHETNPPTAEYDVSGYQFVRVYGAHTAHPRHDGGYVIEFHNKGDIHVRFDNGKNRYFNETHKEWIYPAPSDSK